MDGTVARPDFLARSIAIWGEQPTGMPLSGMVSDARGAGS